MRNLRHIAASLPEAFGGSRRDDPGACCDVADGVADPPPFAEAEPAARDPAIATVEAAQMETEALVRHIVARYHEVHRREIVELVRLARRVEAAHGGHPAAPLGLADLLARVRSEMEEHLKKEEEGLFPMILDGHPDLDAAIDILRADHADHGERLRRLAVLTRDHTPPADACRTWRALAAGTRKFADDLRAHIDLEDSVLFPRFSR